MKAKPVIAVINSSEDIVEAIELALSTEGFKVVTAHVPDIKRGKQDFLQLLRKSDPKIIVYDIAPPYEENWTFYQLLEGLEDMNNRKVILTTTNQEAVKKIVGKKINIEILGKPYDYEKIVTAAKKIDGMKE